MSLSIDRDHSGLFSVVGAPYVGERHTDNSDHFAAAKDEFPRETGIANLWVVFYLVIAAAGLFGSGALGRAFEFAISLFK